MESIIVSMLDERAKSLFLEFNGTPSFKCPKLGCQNFTLGFPAWRARHAHISEHERPYHCSVRGCHAEIIGFKSRSELRQHVEFYHPIPSPQPLFPTSKPKKLQSTFESCVKGNLESLRMRIGEGVDVNSSRPGTRDTPLTLAESNGHPLICKLLLDHGASQLLDPITGNLAPLKEAMDRKDLDLFSLLFHALTPQEKKAFVTSPRYTRAVVDAIHCWDHRVLGCYLSLYDESIDQDNAQPMCFIHQAIYEQASLPNLEFVLDWAALHITSKEKITDTESFQTAVSLNPKHLYSSITTDCHSTLLHMVSEARNTSAMSFLLQHFKQFDLCRQDKLGDTPLHTAVRNESPEAIVQMLISADDDEAVNQQNHEGRLPLHLVPLGGDKNVILLATHTKDLTVQDLQR